MKSADSTAIRHERNAASNSSSDRPTTAAANSGIRDAIFSASSPKRAVRPPTYALAPEPWSAAGIDVVAETVDERAGRVVLRAVARA